MSLFIFVVLLIWVWGGSHNADSGPRFAMRLWGTIFAIAYLALALFTSWWIALISLIVLFGAIFVYSLL